MLYEVITDDVGFAIADGAGDTGKNPLQVDAVGPDLDGTRRLLLHVPFQHNAPFGIAIHHMRAILGMNGYPPASGDKADHRVSRQRIAAFGESDQDIVYAVDLDGTGRLLAYLLKNLFKAARPCSYNFV